MPLLLDALRTQAGFSLLADFLALAAAAGLLLADGKPVRDSLLSLIIPAALLALLEIVATVLDPLRRRLKALAGRLRTVETAAPEDQALARKAILGLPARAAWRSALAWAAAFLVWALLLKKAGGESAAAYWWASLPVGLAWTACGLPLAALAQWVFNLWSAEKILPAFFETEAGFQAAPEINATLEHGLRRGFFILAAVAFVLLAGQAAMVATASPGWPLPAGFWGGFLWLALWLGLAAWGLALRFSKGLVQPLLDLDFSSKHLLARDYDLVLDPAPFKEINQLSASLSGLARGLAEEEALRSTFAPWTSRAQAARYLEGGLKLDGEKKDVTLLACCLPGCEARLAGMPPADAVKALNRYLQVACGVVESFQGCLQAVEGSRVLAWFDPALCGDSASQAALCGLALKQRLDIWNQQASIQGRPSFAYGIGLGSGEVLAGHLGPAERRVYGLVGEPVRRASVLSLAGSGPWMDQATEARLGPEFLRQASTDKSFDFNAFHLEGGPQPVPQGDARP